MSVNNIKDVQSAYQNKVNEKIKKIKETLANGIKNATNDPKKYKELLDFTKKFTNYSMNNTMIIFLTGLIRGKDYQFCRTFKQWNKEGIKINPGEVAIYILAPNTYKIHIIRDLQEQKELTVYDNYYKTNKLKYENKNKYKYIRYETRLSNKNPYRTLPIFDISQTNAPMEYLPKVLQGLKEKNIPNEIQLKLVESYITNEIELPIEYIDYGIAGKKGALHLNPDDTFKITLNSRNTHTQSVKTLLHELGHHVFEHLVEKDKYTKNEKEVMAESFAYIVSNYFGLDTSEYSFDYIAGWKGEVVDDMRYEDILSTVLSKSEKSIKSIENYYQKSINKEFTPGIAV
ncbi:ImmA/IrrE family metallo-endopeptidase (plasmid) [Mycoplasmatota bacterium]|nr:ImmA/IrrE family metallo-endopeptidase [Mycoplasmatota bacterium]